MKAAHDRFKRRSYGGKAEPVIHAAATKATDCRPWYDRRPHAGAESVTAIKMIRTPFASGGPVLEGSPLVACPGYWAMTARGL